MLWRLLVNHCDQETFEVTYLNEHLAELLCMSTSTISRWLQFFENKGWIERPRRFGGRGLGNTIIVTWLQRGKELHERRKKAEQYQAEKKERKRQNLERYAQRQTELKTPKDLNSRGAVLGTMRQILAPRINSEGVVERCLSVAGKWLKKGYPLERMKQILETLKAIDHIPVPRWATDARSVFRWFESLLLKLASMGSAWWDKLKIRLEAKHFHKLAQKVEEAAETGQGCPVCGNPHKDPQRCSEWAYLRRDAAMKEYRRDVWPNQTNYENHALVA